MSRLDEWEHHRGPVRRSKGSRYKPAQPKRANARAVQLQMKLLGGTTAKDKGEPFNDDIGHLG